MYPIDKNTVVKIFISTLIALSCATLTAILMYLCMAFINWDWEWMQFSQWNIGGRIFFLYCFIAVPGIMALGGVLTFLSFK